MQTIIFLTIGGVFILAIQLSRAPLFSEPPSERIFIAYVLSNRLYLLKAFAYYKNLYLNCKKS